MFRIGLASEHSAINRALCKVGLAAALGLSLVLSGGVFAKTPTLPTDLPRVALATLPAQAQATHRLILSGGPFPYDKDGTVFGNRERLLPPKARGFYREYTVRTPGANNRGARRIVCGGIPANRPENCFFTNDHYASFSRIVQ